jgi:hypothetical protein
LPAWCSTDGPTHPLDRQPDAGGGARVAPPARGRSGARALGAGFTVAHTRSLDHARALAARAAGEDVP